MGGSSQQEGSVNSVDSVGILMFSHRFHRSAQMLGCVDSPTDFTEFTELLAEIVLPQISQIYTEIRLSSRGCIRVICGSHFAAAEARIPPLLSSTPNESV